MPAMANMDTHICTQSQHGGRRHHFVVVGGLRASLALLLFSIVVKLLFIYALSRLNAARFVAHTHKTQA